MRSAATTLCVVAIALATGCTHSTSAAGGPPRRDAAKATCEMPRLTRLPSGVEPHDRELVPLSSTLLGVETTFDDGARRSVVVIAGGYLDDAFEAYDDLAEVERVDTKVGRMTVLEGTLLNDTVRAAYWRAADVAAPCDVRAIVAVNVADRVFERMLAGVR